MAISLDEIDVRLLEELERDADRANVELAKIVGLSPPATLHRVRRLKESGIIERIAARLDPDAAGFPLQVYVAVTMGRHDEAGSRRFEKTVMDLPEVVAADHVTGETDVLLWVVARDVAQLQRVLMILSTKGGAQRMITLLRLEALKRPSGLPLST